MKKSWQALLSYQVESRILWGEEAHSPRIWKDHLLTRRRREGKPTVKWCTGGTREAAGQNDGKGRTPVSQRGQKALCRMPRATARAEEMMGMAVRYQAFWAAFFPFPTLAFIYLIHQNAMTTEAWERNVPFRTLWKKWRTLTTLVLPKGSALSSALNHCHYVPWAPNRSLAPVQSPLSIPITCQLECKPSYLLDVHHSPWSDANLVSHLHPNFVFGTKKKTI